MLRRLWLRLPVVVRGVLLGELVVTLGVLPPELAMLGNLRWTPQLPWLLLPVAAWLWLYWRYLAGSGWPRRTAATRRTLLRGRPVAPGLWSVALWAGGLGLAACFSLGMLTVTLARTPAAAFRLSVDFARYPWWTVACCLIAISVTAGVVEEAGFRGYMLSAVESRHGWALATAVTGFMFFLDHHLSHDYATIAYLPFMVGVSVVHALLVRLTGSIRPSILLHAAFDLAVTPLMYGLVGTGAFFGEPTPRRLFLELGSLALLGLASLLAFRRLATAAQAIRPEH